MERIENELRDLILKNEGLIYSIAKKFQGDMEDFFQVGCIGLIQAYRKYNASLGSKFTTYAYSYIFGEIYNYVLKNKNIRINKEQAKLNMAIHKAYDFLSQKLNHEPTDNELASFLEIPVLKLIETRNINNMVSLDDDTNDINLYDFISFDEKDKDELILLRDSLKKLSKEERELILKRYFYNMTQSEIAKQIGINQVKVSREEGKVLTKLRNYM